MGGSEMSKYDELKKLSQEIQSIADDFKVFVEKLDEKIKSSKAIPYISIKDSPEDLSMRDSQLRQYIFSIREDRLNTLEEDKKDKIRDIFNRIVIYFLLLELLYLASKRSKIRQLGIEEFLTIDPKNDPKNEKDEKNSKIIISINPKYYYSIEYRVINMPLDISGNVTDVKKVEEKLKKEFSYLTEHIRSLISSIEKVMKGEFNKFLTEFTDKDKRFLKKSINKLALYNKVIEIFFLIAELFEELKLEKSSKS